MTGLLHEQEFSRKTFLKSGGALIVGFSTIGGLLAGTAAADDQFSSHGPYDPRQVDSWLVVNPDNTVGVKLTRVELGQGSTTGLAMITAEELNLDIGQMRLITSDTDITPNTGTTAGSSSIQRAGKSVRAAAAAAHQALLALASQKLAVPVTSLTSSRGVVSGGGKSVTFGELVGGKLINVQAAPGYNLAATSGNPPRAGAGLSPGAPLTKPVSQYALLGKDPGPPRVDIPAKITGTYVYVHGIRIPGMLHGRIVRPRGQGAYGDGTNPRLLSVDVGSVSHIPNVKVLQKGNFLAVVAPKEYDAIQAAAQLKARWAPMPPLPGVGNLWGAMRRQDSAGKAPARILVDTGDVDKALAGASKTLSQTYKYHYNGHMPIGPSCCVADVTATGARIFSNTQDPYGTRSAVAQILGLKDEQVRVTYYEGSSVYGSAPYNDAAQSAAVMSQLAKAPVRLQFMRWDEHGYDNYGPAQMMDIRAGIDAKGNLVGSESVVFGPPYYSTTPALALTGVAEQNFSGTNHVDTTTTGTQYSTGNRRVIGKTLPLENNYFKSIYLRAPQAPQTTFGYEQMIDELAHAANMDPYQFRLQNVATLASDRANGLETLTWDRWKMVVTRLGQLMQWQPKVAASNLSSANVVKGRGIAFGAYAGTMVALGADVTVNKKTGKITCTHAYCAQDTGFTQYPGGIENQAVGSMVQGASRALFEEVAFNKGNVTSLDWATYPIMRFKDAPEITFSYVQRTDIPGNSVGTVKNGTSTPAGSIAKDGILSTGSGEPPTSAIGAAIANAFFDATGVRIREAPMTTGRVRAVLRAARVA